VLSTQKVIDKARQIAAHQLEVAEDDLDFEEGTFRIKGAPDRSITIREVATQSYLAHDLPDHLEPGLEATTFFDPPGITFPFGTHVAVVAVEPASGEIEIEQYLAVDDCGIQINPKLVEGQIHGSLAQGFAQTLYEHAIYDSTGNLLTGSLQDYAVPKAIHIPEIDTDETETPSPHNPLGAKGVGEAGTTGAPPAVVNAVVDALEPFGIDHIDMPLTPEVVWQAIRDAR
jgi:carbon-monoxide dehydrogenase large subunit